MTERFEALIRALTDPGHTQALHDRLAGDTAAQEAIAWARRTISDADDPVFTLRTGGGLVGPVWDRILHSVEGAPLAQGDELGRYVVLEHVGSGGMGSVYSAYDPQLDRRVALKVLHATGAGDQDRLLREARALAQLDHPNVVTVHDAGVFEGRVFLAMEFVDGVDLRRWAVGRPWQEILGAYLGAGRGLAAAHTAGLVHRDFKPENVIVDATGEPHVVDFGLARPSEDGDATTRVIGTPGYMSPEQLLDGRFDARSDQFAFAAALWEAFYGGRPYAGDDLASARVAMATPCLVEPPPAPVTPRVRRILEQALAPDPSHRHSALGAMLDLLGDDPEARVRGRLLVALPVVAAGLVLAWVALRPAAALCADAADQLAGIWDAARADELRQAFAASGAPDADANYARTAAALDRYAAGWAAMHGDSCAATNIRGEQSPALLDLRTTCLGRRRVELQAAVNGLLAGDADVQSRANDIALGLEPLAGCADVALLTSVAPRPTRPDALAQLESLEGRLAEARVLADSVGPAAVLPAAEALAAEAEALGYAPLTAEAWHLVADQQEYAADFDAAESSLFRAWEAAERSGHSEYVIRALNLLVWMEGNDRMRPARADRWAGLALAAIERSDAGPYVRAEFYSNRGSGLHQEGLYAEALAAHAVALKLREEMFGPDHVEVGKTLTNMGSTHNSAGRFEEALELFERAATIFEAELGEHHRTAMSASNIGATYLSLGDGVRALSHHERALAIRRRVYGDDGFFVASSLANVGYALVATDPLAALPYFEDAERIFALYVPEDHYYRVVPVSGRGHALAEAGRLDEAIPLLRRSVAGFAVAENSPVQGLAGDLLRLARAIFDSGGNRQEALEFAREALAVASKVPGEQLGLQGSIVEWLDTNFPGAR